MYCTFCTRRIRGLRVSTRFAGFFMHWLIYCSMQVEHSLIGEYSPLTPSRPPCLLFLYLWACGGRGRSPLIPLPQSKHTRTLTHTHRHRHTHRHTHTRTHIVLVILFDFPALRIEFCFVHFFLFQRRSSWTFVPQRESW